MRSSEYAWILDPPKLISLREFSDRDSGAAMSIVRLGNPRTPVFSWSVREIVIRKASHLLGW
jgi:hypothetical protein